MLERMTMNTVLEYDHDRWNLLVAALALAGPAADYDDGPVLPILTGFFALEPEQALQASYWAGALTQEEIVAEMHKMFWRGGRGLSLPTPETKEGRRPGAGLDTSK